MPTQRPLWLPVLIITAFAAPRAVDAQDYDFGRAGMGAWTIPVPLDIQAQNDLQPGQGMLVIGVRPGSTASTLGIQAGDILTSINNTPIASRHDIRDIIGSVQPGDAAQANVITPDGEAQTLSGTFQQRPQRFNWAGLGAGAPPLGDPGALAAIAAGPGGMGPGRAGVADPFAGDTVNAQRQELLAQQQAIQQTLELLASLRADLAAAGNQLTGAWHLQYQLDPASAVATATLAGLPRVAPTAAADVMAHPSEQAAGDASPWSCSISIGSPSAPY